MRYTFLKAVIFNSFLASALWPAAIMAAPVDYRLVPEESNISFEAQATLHKVPGEGTVLGTSVSFDPETGNFKMPFTVEIPVESLKTGIGRRDKAMWKMFGSKDYPVIRWTAEKAECSEVAGQSEPFLCKAEGWLQIGERRQKEDLEAAVTLDGDKVKAEGAVIVKRKDYDLKPPSLLGLMRVADEVSVHFNTVWSAGNVQPEKDI